MQQSDIVCITMKESGLSEAQMAGLRAYGERRRAATRERILFAAYQLIAEFGHRELSIERLTEQPGVSTGSVYNNFHNLDHLVIRYIDHRAMKLLATKGIEEYAGDDVLFKVADTLVDVEYRQPGILQRMRAGVPDNTTSEEMLPGLHGLLMDTIIDGQQDGVYRVDVAEQHLIEGYFGAIASPFYDMTERAAANKRAMVIIDGMHPPTT